MKSIYTRDYKSTIQRLKNARIRSGLTQKEVSNKLNKPQSYISKIENCQRRIDVSELKILANLYKVTPSTLI